MAAWIATFTFGWFAAPRERNGERDASRRRGTLGDGAEAREIPAAAEGATAGERVQPTVIDGIPATELLARVRAGDRDAFATLYLAFYERLARFGFTLVGARDVAQEIVQDVFLSPWTRRESFTVREDISVYLFTSVRHHATTRARHARVVQRVEDADPAATGSAPALGASPVLPDEAAITADVRRVVREALATLSERDRAALLLRWDQGKTYEEIGAVLGISAMGAHKMVTRALARVRPLVERFREREGG